MLSGMHRANAHVDLVAVARDVATREGFVVSFPEGSIDSLPTRMPPEDGPIADERTRPWSSIDNEESRDLDQIEVSERLPSGMIRVCVGIADVDAFVPKGSILDRHAALNTTSLYAGVATFPMLPDEVSSGLSSLLPGEDRLAVVTQMDVAADGTTHDVKVYRALVRNHAKLVYEDIGRWFDGGPRPRGLDAHSDMEAQLRMQDEAATRLRRRRNERGALHLETTEARAVAKDGQVVDLQVVAKNRGRELVEDFMIAANGATARWLEERRLASIRRVVRKPKRWDRIVALAAESGFTLPAEPDALSLAHFLDARREAAPERFGEVSLSVVKLMGPGEYAVADPDCPEGHFGLAVEDYAHSTAPNRRFGDLVTQRLLKAAARGERAAYDVRELGLVAARCTEREDHARKFERNMRKVWAASFLSTRIGESFDAVVTGVTDKGTFVRLLAPPAEGRVVSGEAGLDVGDATRVRLVATEPSRGFIDFARD